MFIRFFFHVLLKLVKIGKLEDNFVYLYIKYDNFFFYSCYTCLTKKSVEHFVDIIRPKQQGNSQ